MLQILKHKPVGVQPMEDARKLEILSLLESGSTQVCKTMLTLNHLLNNKFETNQTIAQQLGVSIPSISQVRSKYRLKREVLGDGKDDDYCHWLGMISKMLPTLSDSLKDKCVTEIVEAHSKGEPVGKIGTKYREMLQGGES
ncbi:hypothetical protein [Psychromonas sp. Urea-02u-13]|uniref:hypothetical protein n=1 Tax=Psychromonas sp. Urea-02u-13 TaxID=2058326 RepID=UPI0012FEAD39|nr:hypothetical protein [Psychromonas sp. Urea-02u-13]